MHPWRAGVQYWAIRLAQGTLVPTGSIPSHQLLIELLATFLALKAFGKTWQGIMVLLYLDNVMTVTYINQKGGTALSPSHLNVDVVHRKKIPLVAEHLLVHLIVIADEESRSLRDCCDWMLNPKIFHTIQNAMGHLEIDLFATRLTK